MKKKSAYYRKLICVSLLIGILNFTGCNTLFRPEEFYLSDINSEQELDEAISGIADYFHLLTISTLYQSTELFGDDLFDPITTGPFPYQKYYQGGNTCTKGRESFEIKDDIWINMYTIIASCNNILSQFQLDKVSDKTIKQLLGEALFYRAFCYYRLSLIYGQVPIVDNPNIDYTTPKASYEELYRFIEKDLKQAIELLPIQKTECRIPNESPGRGTAKALLGEVYLSWSGFPIKDISKYALAAQVTGELIDSSNFYGYELLPDFEDLWNKKSVYNNEAIFTNYFKLPENEIDYYRYIGRIAFVGELYFTGFSPDDKVILALSRNPLSEIEFYNNYPKGYRKDVTFYTRIYVDPVRIGIGTEFEIAGLDSGYFDIEKTDCGGRATYRKFFIDTLQLRRVLNSELSIRILGCPRIYLIRYAQTLLTYAEASARSGNINEKAYECVNLVRRRANNLPLNKPSPYDLPQSLSPEAFADSVVQERAWELAGEPGHRWFDMVRSGIVEKVFENRDPNDGGPFEYSTNDKYFFPIPEHDINLNPNLGEQGD